MKKVVLLVVGLIVLVSAVRVFWLFENAKIGVHIVSTDPNKLQVRTYKKACDAFSLKDAQSILGQRTVSGNLAKSSVIAAGYAQTSCEYRVPATQTSDEKVITIDLYDSDVTNTKTAFEKAEGSDPQVLVGIGQKAFWDAQKNKLNVLKNQYWITITYQEGARKVTYSLPQQIATKIVGSL